MMESPTTPNLIRTLPMHLGLAALNWLISNAASQSARNGLPNWKGLQNRANPWENLPQNPALADALETESKERLQSLLKGIQAYAHHPYRRALKDPPVFWQKKGVRLLDYANRKKSNNGPIIFLIPSLINRSYILDLRQDNSLVRHLSTLGMHPLLLDWGSPLQTDKNMDCAAYIAEYLVEALAAIRVASKQPIILAGYCLGGVLALALAQLQSKYLTGLALLATPWNFFIEDFARIRLGNEDVDLLEGVLERFDLLPPEIVQSLFYSLNPFVFDHKFRHFATIESISEEAKHFVALEQWVNDGVPITQGVARDCLVHWPQHNILAKKEWKVMEETIDPASLTLPAFIAIPHNDHIVPRRCAMALVSLMPHATLCQPRAGHVGMMAGGRAKQELWQPFVEWARGI